MGLTGLTPGTFTLPTKMIELDAGVHEVPQREESVISRLSISDQKSNFFGVWTHSHSWFKAVTKDVFQSRS